MWKKMMYIVGVLMILTSVVSLSTLGATCTDSDGGLRFYTKGKVTYGRIFTDVCVGDYIREYYCNSNGFPALLSRYCKWGCSYGKCNTYPVCGNGYKEYGEECDRGTNNGAVCNPQYSSSCDYCSTSCRLIMVYGSYCGDGVVYSLYENCDDQNNQNDDGCSSTCQTEINEGECIPEGNFGEQQQEAEQYCNPIDNIQICKSNDFCKWVSLGYCIPNGDFGEQQQEAKDYCDSIQTKQSCDVENGELCRWDAIKK